MATASGVGRMRISMVGSWQPFGGDGGDSGDNGEKSGLLSVVNARCVRCALRGWCLSG